MITILVALQIVSWLILAVVIFALFALARQVGVLHERLVPVGALTPRGGPVVGEPGPVIATRDLNGDLVRIGGAAQTAKRQLLLFVARRCPMCKTIIPIAKSVAQREQIDLIFLGDDEHEEQLTFVVSARLEDYPFVNDSDVGIAFGVAKLPHAVLLSPEGTVLAAGLVNSREHVESLVAAADTGVPDLQAYLRRQPAELEGRLS